MILSDNTVGYYCAANFGKLGDKIILNDRTYTIVDRFGNNGGAKYKIDIFIADGHSKCIELGRYTATVIRL